jgi:NADH dehydrogenase
MTPARRVVVFGGTGFLGQRVVHHLLDHGFAVRIATRHPERSRGMFAGKDSGLASIWADINEDRSLRAAVRDVFAVVNAVSLYTEQGAETFHAVHVVAAARLASHARQSKVERLVQLSGIGANAASRSSYIRARGEGEDAVRREFPGAIVIRPAVMFGPDDAFLSAIVKLLRTLPVFPMFGDGRTALQPSYVEDVAEAVVRSLDAPDSDVIFELGGPRIYTYKELLASVGEHIGSRPLLLPLPFAVWRPLALAAEMLPSPPITRNQVELMQIDNIASGKYPGFDTLGIRPHGIEAVLASMPGPQWTT